MRQNLLETYSNQIRVAEAYVYKHFNGKSISNNTKLTTAVLLDNTNRWISTALNESLSTTRRDLGDWKKFCLNLTNLAVPTLIANDLVIVHPMTSYSGSVAYLEYASLTNKGGVKVGDTFNSVFGLGEMNEARQQFTSQVIVENISDGTLPVLTPIKCGKFYNTEDGQYYDVKAIKADGTADFLAVADVCTVEQADSSKDNQSDKFDYSPDHFATSVTWNKEKLASYAKIAYVAHEFQMETVPAHDIPTIGPVMKHIPLVAEPRRIAVRYDQITAYQANTDYGLSLDQQIAEQACGELAYEIDTEIVNMLYNAAPEVAELTFSKTLPAGVSKFEHYNGFLELVEAAKAYMYKITGKFHPTYMVVAADVMTVLRFVNGFTPVKVSKINGPYKVGELDGLAIYVSPIMKTGEFLFGVNGSDMMSSAGVYAPYMAIVPTQLLGTPDGGLAQGFSTWYAKAILNKSLLCKGKIVA